MPPEHSEDRRPHGQGGHDLPRILPGVPPSELHGFRFARTFAGFDAERRPKVFGHVVDAGERERLHNYLRAGEWIRAARGFGRDLIAPDRPDQVPIGTATDGEWIWDESVAYYLMEHHVAPDPDLHQRIRQTGYKCPPVTEERSLAALDALREHNEIARGRRS